MARCARAGTSGACEYAWHLQVGGCGNSVWVDVAGGSVSADCYDCEGMAGVCGPRMYRWVRASTAGGKGATGRAGEYGVCMCGLVVV